MLSGRGRRVHNRKAHVLGQGHSRRIKRKRSRAQPVQPVTVRRQRAQTLRKQWFAENRKKDNADDDFLKSLDEILKEPVLFDEDFSSDTEDQPNAKGRSDTGKRL